MPLKALVFAILSPLTSFAASSSPPFFDLAHRPTVTCESVLSDGGSPTTLPDQFRFDLIAQFERTYIKDTWPTPAFSSDGSVMVARASSSAPSPAPKEVQGGVLILDLDNLESSFIPLPEEVRAEVIRISPSGKYATLEAQGGFFTLIDIATKRFKHIRVDRTGQTTAFYPHFYFDSKDRAFWFSQTGEVWKLNPSEFMSSSKPKETLELYLQAEDSRPATPYKSGQTKDWLLSYSSGDYELIGLVSKNKQTGQFIANSLAGLNIVHTSLEHNSVIATRRTGRGVIEFLELNIDSLAKGDLNPRVIWSSGISNHSYAHSTTVSSDESHFATQIGQSAFVIEVKTGLIKLEVPDMIKDSGIPTYNNGYISGYENDFVFFRSNPQILLQYDFSRDEVTEIPISHETDIAVGPGGSVTYAAHVQPLNGPEGLLSIAPFKTGTISPGIYLGDQRLEGFYVPNAPMGWVHSSPDGSHLVYTLKDEEDDSFELRVTKVTRP